jgi:hypothetical protein
MAGTALICTPATVARVVHWTALVGGQVGCFLYPSTRALASRIIGE